MAEFDKTQPNQFEKRGINPFNNPTPGESLTRDPEQKFPWEQPPQLTEVDSVIKEIFINITEKEKLLELLRPGKRLEEYRVGFRQGGTGFDQSFEEAGPRQR